MSQFLDMGGILKYGLFFAFCYLCTYSTLGVTAEQCEGASESESTQSKFRWIKKGMRVPWWVMGGAIEGTLYMLNPLPSRGPFIWNRKGRLTLHAVTKKMLKNPEASFTESEALILRKTDLYDRAERFQNNLQNVPKRTRLKARVSSFTKWTPKLYGWALVGSTIGVDEWLGIESYLEKSHTSPKDFVELIWDITYFPHFAVRIKKGASDLVYSFSAKHLLAIPYRRYFAGPVLHEMSVKFSANQKGFKPAEKQVFLAFQREAILLRNQFMASSDASDRERITQAFSELEIRWTVYLEETGVETTRPEIVSEDSIEAKWDFPEKPVLDRYFSRRYSRTFVVMRLNLTKVEVEHFDDAVSQYVSYAYQNITLVNDCSAMAFIKVAQILGIDVPPYVSVSPGASLAYLKALRASGHPKVGKISYINPHSETETLSNMTYRLRDAYVTYVEANLHFFTSPLYVGVNSYLKVHDTPLVWVEKSSVDSLANYFYDTRRVLEKEGFIESKPQTRTPK